MEGIIFEVGATPALCCETPSVGVLQALSLHSCIFFASRLVMYLTCPPHCRTPPNFTTQEPGTRCYFDAWRNGAISCDGFSTRMDTLWSAAIRFGWASSL